MDHLDGILNYCRNKVRFGVVEAINGNIKTHPSSKGPWLQESHLPAAQGAAHGDHQDRIHRSSEGSLKRAPLRILVQSRKKTLFVIAGLFIMIVKNGIRIATLTLLANYVDPGFLYGNLHPEGGLSSF